MRRASSIATATRISWNGHIRTVRLSRRPTGSSPRKREKQAIVPVQVCMSTCRCNMCVRNVGIECVQTLYVDKLKVQNFIMYIVTDVCGPNHLIITISFLCMICYGGIGVLEIYQSYCMYIVNYSFIWRNKINLYDSTLVIILFWIIQNWFFQKTDFFFIEVKM